ncbi:hypothetical protein CK486_03270 [Pseudomonas sp. HAR-UPW-AIA-41]|uniref:hypothetical protein n=1 Tax=Pseudomonas sp. HAR-UPW-AIA-41 TaxID=1985301 RepID=UPI000BB351EA|nr:hypothetical protein [Pseudomonas sp. HAR-UPW-AIA-41]PAV49800.1 hypothetical protein CK486_03270 [Pseudomonas sp. HAR-UPW-AIA-41]
MQNTTRQNRFITTALLLGSLITLGSTSSFAADGSDRLKLKAAPVVSKLQRLAEDGSDRLRQRQQRSDSQSHEDVRLAEDGSERTRLYWHKRQLDVAEGGADRVLASRKA